MLKLKSIIILSIMISLTLTVVSAQSETVTNTHNSDINDAKYVNPKDYYIDENGSQVTCAYDTVCFNNVSMSNGYNAYAIQDGGHIETNDSKTHHSFWNDTFHVVDANDTDAVAGHWHHTGNIQWLSETTYLIIDFPAFRNSNQFHKDL